MESLPIELFLLKSRGCVFFTLDINDAGQLQELSAHLGFGSADLTDFYSAVRPMPSWELGRFPHLVDSTAHCATSAQRPEAVERLAGIG
jgi:hypothetical protein